MFLPVNRILFILSGKRAITDCLLCLDTERFLLLWPLFSAAVSVSISQLECSNFWIACQEITPFLHSCSFTVTYLTGKSEVLNYWHFAWYLDTSYSQISLVKFNFYCYICIFPESIFIQSLLMILFRPRNPLVTEHVQLLAYLGPKTRHKSILFIASISPCSFTWDT